MMAVKQTLNYPGPTAGVTIKGAENDVTSYYDAIAAPSSDQQIAILSISVGYDRIPPSDTAVIIAHGNSNTILMGLDAGGRSASGRGYLYPPLLPAGEKLSVKAYGSHASLIIIYIQYMIVPV